MRVLYRADGGHPLGTGHILRAARVLRELGRMTDLTARLLVADDPAALRLAALAPAEIGILPPRADPNAHKPLLNAGPVLTEIARDAFDLVAIDMLDTPEPDMAALRATGIPLLTFDDRGRGRLHADTIVNILVTEPEPLILPSECRLLEGGDYVTLDSIFAEAHNAPRLRNFGELERVFVAMGGADAAGLTVKVAEALRRVTGIRRVDIAAGMAFPHHEALASAIAGAPWEVEVHRDLPNLVERYHAADLCIVAGGLTMYEAACVGAPALAVCQPIDHQYELAERLTAAGVMSSAGDGLSASVECIAEAVRALAPAGVRREMSRLGPGLVDGRGSQRVARAFVEAATPMHVS